MLNSISISSKYKIGQYSFTNYKLYLLTGFFVASNILLPLAFHVFGLGPRIFLPIYFFTLIAGLKFGWRAGLITGLLSPIINYYLTGMPLISMLPLVAFKGSILGLIGGILASRRKNMHLSDVLLVIFAYQLFGIIFGYFITKNTNIIFDDVLTGYPGLLLQLFGGYAILKIFERYERKNN